MSRTYGKAQDLIDFTRASSATYLDSDGLLKTASNNTPRIEYDANGNLLGLLVEESRTNLVTYSDDFTDSSWVATNFSTSGALPVVTANQAVAPDGTARADKIVFDAVDASGNSAIYHNVTAFNGQGCYSIWLKSDSGNVTLRLRIDYSGSSAAKNITVTESWQRFDLTTASGLTGIYQVSLRLRPSQGTDTTGTIYAYNAQLEAGSFPTSAIPTSGSTATRSADVASLSTSAFGYNSVEGTLFVEMDVYSASVGSNGFVLSDGTLSNRLYIANTGTGAPHLRAFVGGSDQGLTSASPASSITANTMYKMAGAYKENDAAFTRDGFSVGTDSSFNIPSVTTAYIGVGADGNSSMSGHIKSLKYIPRRLTNAQLQELTS